MSVVLCAAIVLSCVMVGCAASDDAATAGFRTPEATADALATLPTPGDSQAQTEPVAALLPTELDGTQLHTFPVGQDMTARVAITLQIDPGRLEVAYASEHGARFFQAYALRVPGVSGPALIEAFAAAAYDPLDGAVSRDEFTLADKTVTVVEQATTAGRIGTYYAYPLGDALLVVQAFDAQVAADVLAALP